MAAMSTSLRVTAALGLPAVLLLDCATRSDNVKTKANKPTEFAALKYNAL